MEQIEAGKERVKQISNVLRAETLEPAKREAEGIVAKARKQAEEVLHEARERAEEIVKEAREGLVKEREVFESSLKQGYKQTLEMLRQAVTERFFSHELKELVGKNMRDPKGLGELIGVVIEAVKKEGLDTDISVYISSALSTAAINEQLSKEILDTLKEKSVVVSGIGGGVKVALHEENIVLDLSDTALEEMIANYIRKDFREMIF